MNKPKSVSIIEAARSSGLTDKEWCLANGVSINTFYYNVRRLRNMACSVPKHTDRHKSLPQAGVPLVDGRTCHRSAEGDTAGNRPQRFLIVQKVEIYNALDKLH